MVKLTTFQLRPRVSLPLARRLKAYAASLATTETAVVEAALSQYLDGTSDHTAVMRRLDRLDRRYQGMQRDIQMVAEAFAAFVQLWYAYTPELPDDARAAARRSSGRRYAVYLQLVAQRITRGKPFLQELIDDGDGNSAPTPEMEFSDHAAE